MGVNAQTPTTNLNKLNRYGFLVFAIGNAGKNLLRVGLRIGVRFLEFAKESLPLSITMARLELQFTKSLLIIYLFFCILIPIYIGSNPNLKLFTKHFYIFLFFFLNEVYCVRI